MKIEKQQVIQGVRDYLNDNLLERKEVVDLLLCGILTRSHVFMLGPPGVAKSMLLFLLSSCFSDARQFIINMYKTTKPTEIFGPQSLSALRNDELKYNYKGYFPDSEFVMAEELFKASSATLNSLLTGMQDRKFVNGKDVIDIPLITMIATSNETPADESLRALYDRFTVRLYVDYLKDPENFKALIRNDFQTGVPKPELTLADLEQAQREVRAVEIGSDFLDALAEIRFMAHHDPEYTNVHISDRRWKPAVQVAQAYRYLHGGNRLTQDDILTLYHCLWSEASDRPLVKSLVLSGVGAEYRTIIGLSETLKEAMSQMKSLNSKDSAEYKEFSNTAAGLLKELDKGDGNRSYNSDRANRLRKRIAYFQTLCNQKIAELTGLDTETVADIYGVPASRDLTEVIDV